MSLKLTAILPWVVVTALSSVGQITPTEVRRLTPSRTIKRELTRGETHVYLVSLRQGKFLHVEVDQRGIDVVISFFAPDGTKLAELNNRHVDYGQEPLSFAATADGLYRLELTASTTTTMSGRYAVRADQVRGVTPGDRVRIEAERAAAEGQRLRVQGKAESYRGALERYQVALKKWREIGDHYWEATTLTNVGLIYDVLGERQKALETYDAALLLCKGVKDLTGEWRILNNLGAIHQSLGDRQKALDLARQALVIARHAGDRRSEATTLLNIGNIHGLISEGQRALDSFRLALALLRALGDRAGEANTLIRIGLGHHVLGHYQMALDNYMLALPLHQAIGNSGGEADALVRIGDTYSDLGDKQKALDYYNRALPLKRAARDAGGEGEILDYIGSVYSNLDEKEKALDYFKRAVQLRRLAEDKSGEALSLVNVGMVYSNLGQDQKALDYYNQALSLRRATGDRSGEVPVLNLIGSTYRKVGENQKALDYHNRALPLTRGANGDRVHEADTLTDIGNVYYALRDKQKALEFYKQALPLWQAFKRRRFEAYTLNKIGIIYSDLGEKQKALEFYSEALQLSRATADKSGEAATLARVGNLYRDLGETTKAFGYYNQSLSLSRAVGDRSSEALTLINLMLLEGVLRNYPLAIFYGKHAISIYQDLRSNIQGLEPDVQETFLHSVEIWYRTLADLLISQGRLPEAQQVLGMLKEEEFFEFVRRDASEVAALSQRADLTAQEQKAFAEYASLADSISAIANKQSALKAKLKALPEGTTLPGVEQAEYERLTAELETANKGFALFLERMTGEFSKAQRSDIRENRGLQRDLREWGAGTVALYTIVGEDRYRVILTTPNTQVDGKTEIRAAELNQKVLAFREAVQNPRVDPRPLAQELYNILIKPIEKQLEGAQAKTLVWSLDGTLRYLPLAALFDGKQYLAEKYQQVIITLASRTRLSEPVNHNWRGLGLGVSEAKEVSLDGSSQRLGFKALTEVPAELLAIIRDENAADESATAGQGAGVLPGRRMLNKDFTARGFAEALGRNYSLVHIASHFSFRPGDADKSFLLLGDGNSLTLETVRTSDEFDFKGVELLTLSACNTGVGTTGADGKEVEGFGAVAQERGAKAVLATLWPVADESTRELMTRFYRTYATTPNANKAEALRQSQISLLRGGEGTGSGSGDRRSSELAVGVGKPELPLYKPDPRAPFSHPYYWAPFILIGNWR